MFPILSRLNPEKAIKAITTLILNGEILKILARSYRLGTFPFSIVGVAVEFLIRLLIVKLFVPMKRMEAFSIANKLPD